MKRIEHAKSRSQSEVHPPVETSRGRRTRRAMRRVRREVVELRRTPRSIKALINPDRADPHALTLHERSQLRTHPDQHEAKAQELDAIGATKDAKRIRMCRTPALMFYGFYCGVRCCPTCSKRAAKRNRWKIKAALRAMKHPKLVLLAAQSVGFDDLAETLGVVRRALRKLRRRKVWAHVERGAGCIEPQLSRAGMNWNVHLHAIVDAETLDVAATKAAWSDLVARPWETERDLGHAGVEEIRDPDSLVGYVTKPDSWAADPGDSDLRALAIQRSALYRKQLVVQWGGNRGKRPVQRREDADGPVSRVSR